MKRPYNYLHFSKVLIIFVLTIYSNKGISQAIDSLLTSGTLKNLSLEERINLEVILVSKHPEKLIIRNLSVEQLV